MITEIRQPGNKRATNRRRKGVKTTDNRPKTRRGVQTTDNGQQTKDKKRSTDNRQQIKDKKMSTATYVACRWSGAVMYEATQAL